MAAKKWWCERAWFGGAVSPLEADGPMTGGPLTGGPLTGGPLTGGPLEMSTPRVLITVDDGIITSVESDVDCPPEATRLPGLTIPALANAHSHAFQRGMRGRTQSGRGSFWTWRDSMYDVANSLEPESYYQMAKAVYSEMVMAGIGVVGEFHYVHHQPGGAFYDNPNAMAEAVVAAANDVGIRITMLDTLYLHGGLDASGYFPVRPEQERFSDRTAVDWVARRERWDMPEHRLVRLGAAAHSIRAVDPDSLVVQQEWALANGAPLHIHVSEQPAENVSVKAAHNATPVEILKERGLLASNVTIVHATHLTGPEVAALGEAETICCFCPTTERDLADGIGPSTDLREAGAAICLGSDSHAVIDLFEEARALELNERLSTMRRGNHRVSDLLIMATSVGYQSLGWPNGGRIEEEALADFITVDLESFRTAGTPAGPEIVFSATPADVTNVVIDGETVVSPTMQPKIDWAAAFGDR